MNFDFIAKRHSLINSEEKVLGGFLSMNAAKEYAENKSFDYIGACYFSVAAPEGNYIFGDENSTIIIKNKWYGPGEKAYVYDSRVDRVIALEETVSM